MDLKPTLTQISPLIYEFEWNLNISDTLLQLQLSLKTKILEDFPNKILELRIGFKTLALVFSKPMESAKLIDWLGTLIPEEAAKPLPNKIWQIPVCYAPETGRDLKTLASEKNLKQEEVILLHSQELYRLHFYGFLPGFMYLNGLHTSLHTPRKSVPDRSVPAGSIAIGASQTGIYPSSSPGGWHLIGQTPLSLFDPRQAKPVFASAGEQIEFVPISLREFENAKRHPSQPQFK